MLISVKLTAMVLLWDTSLNVDGIKTGHTEAAYYAILLPLQQRKYALDFCYDGDALSHLKGRDAAKVKSILYLGFSLL